MRRVNYIGESAEEEGNEEDEEQLVLRVDGDRKPFYMEGMMSGNYFKVILDTGSPVFIFTKNDLEKTVGEKS